MNDVMIALNAHPYLENISDKNIFENIQIFTNLICIVRTETETKRFIYSRKETVEHRPSVCHASFLTTILNQAFFKLSLLRHFKTYRCPGECFAIG